MLLETRAESKSLCRVYITSVDIENALTLERRKKMKAMYGSVQNRIMENVKTIKPEVGMGATECLWSDRNPFVIVEVKDDRHIVVRALDWKRIDSNGMSESQEYEYTSNENNATKQLFLTKQGKWREREGRRLVGNGWYIGSAERYYDFTF